MHWVQMIAGLMGASREFFRDAGQEAMCNEAMEILGWVAGNVHEHAVSRQLQEEVGRGGYYYRIIDEVILLGSELERAEIRMRRAQLYDKWYERGRQQPVNEDELFLRFLRLRGILCEIGGPPAGQDWLVSNPGGQSSSTSEEAQANGGLGQRPGQAHL